MKNKVIVLLLAFIALSLGQQTSATLVGTATDPTGAVTPDVVITIANRETNVTREAKTDASGNYAVPFLPAGQYTVSAARPGFQSIRTENVALQVGQTGRVDFQLQLGDVSQRVTVDGDAALLQTETSAVGTVINTRQIVDLPLNGRNFVQLAQLAPGVQTGTPGSITVRRGRGSLGE